MRVLIYGASNEVALGRMCARGFRDLGHDVEYCARDFKRIPLLGWILNLEECRERLIESIGKFQPDLILTIKGYNLTRETLSRIRGISDATIVNWNPDNPFQVRSQKQRATKYLSTLPEYDVVFTWGEFLTDRLESYGAQRSEYLPFGWDPIIHGPAESKSEYQCEVAFFGTWSKKRERILSSLTDLDFHLRGQSWKVRCWDWSLRRCYRGSQLGADEYAYAMASAEVVVNVIADHNIPDHNMRTFEVPSTGSVLATMRTVGQQQFFEDGKDVIMYESAEELRERIEPLLKDDAVRRELAQRGQEAVSGHTYTDRMRSLLAYL